MWRLLLGTMGVKSLVQGLNAAATAGFEPRTVWSEVRRRNRLATAVSRSIFLKFSGKTPGAICLPQFSFRVVIFSGRTPLEANLAIFGRRALIFFLKALGKNEKWHHFCAHAQWWSPWRRKNVEKGHLAPLNLTFLLIAIDPNGFRRMKEEGLIYKTLPQIF